MTIFTERALGPSLSLLERANCEPIRVRVQTRFSDVYHLAAFGIFSQLDVRALDPRSPLRVFSADAEYLTPRDEVWERPSEFSALISSIVTGGSHLLCAMLERVVQDMGGQVAAIDTDSALVASTKDGGLVPCAGGPHRLTNYQEGSGNAAIWALSYAQVESMRKRFESLNTWRKTLNTPFLKLEKENFDADGIASS